VFLTAKIENVPYSFFPVYLT